MDKKNKAQTIVETEPVVIEEEAIIDSTEVKEDEVIEVEAPEVITSNGDVKTNEPSVESAVETEVKLEILIPFTDKYTKVKYKFGDVIIFNEDRAKELLDDNRKLVKKRGVI